MTPVISCAFSLSRSPVGHADEGQRGQRTASRLPLGDTGHEERQLDVLDRAQHGHEVVELESKPTCPAPVGGALPVGHRRQRAPLDLGVDGVETRQAVQQGGLAATAEAHDRHHLPRPHHEVGAGEGHDRGVAVVDLADASCDHHDVGTIVAGLGQVLAGVAGHRGPP
jgi:hypothetical protein